MTVTLQRLLVLAGQRPVTTTGNSIWSYLLKRSYAQHTYHITTTLPSSCVRGPRCRHPSQGS